MFKPRTYLDLVMAMKTRAVVQIDSEIGIINAISTEDGSGFAWNVKLLVQPQMLLAENRVVTVFFREGAA